MTRTRDIYEPGDLVSWWFGPTRYRGHVQKILRGGDELIVTSLAGVEWHLCPDHTPIDQHGPIVDPIDR